MFNKILIAKLGDQPQRGAATSGTAALSNRILRVAQPSDPSLLATQA